MSRSSARVAALCTACCISIVLSSCASFQRSRDAEGAAGFARLLNAGKAAELAQISSIPFLVDQEIVSLRSDITTFWQSMAKAGFRVEDASLETGEPIGPESYKRFADTMEVKSFFSRYVKKDARILVLVAGSGQRILLLWRDACFSRTLYGFKGPF